MAGGVEAASRREAVGRLGLGDVKSGAALRAQRSSAMAYLEPMNSNAETRGASRTPAATDFRSGSRGSTFWVRHVDNSSSPTGVLRARRRDTRKIQCVAEVLRVKGVAAMPSRTPQASPSNGPQPSNS